MAQSGKAVWSLITAMALALSLWSVGMSDGTIANPGCCLSNGTCENVGGDFLCFGNSTFFEGGVCADDNQSCRPALVGCCEGMFGLCADNMTEISCTETFNGTIVENAECFGENGQNDGAISQGFSESCVTHTATPTATAMETETATPSATNTRVPDGGTCAETGDCEEGLVCLDEVCSQAAAPAPTTSTGALAAIFIALLAVAAVAMSRRRRSPVPT